MREPYQGTFSRQVRNRLVEGGGRLLVTELFLNICINDVLSNYLTVNLPFGGVGISGLGRLQGREGIRGFAYVQSVLEDKLGLKKEPWWFPVSPTIKKLFRRFIHFYYG